MFAPGWKPEPDKAWPERLNSLRRSLGMVFRMFALEFGVGDEALRSWLLGESVPGGPVAKLVEILEREGLEVTSLWHRTAHLREGG